MLSLATAGYLITYSAVEIYDGPNTIKIHVRQSVDTVKEALAEAGVQLLPEDIVIPNPDQPVPADGRIFVRRARLVRLVIGDSEPLVIRTQLQTASDILETMGVSIGPHDLVQVNGQFTDVLAEAQVPDAAPNQPISIELKRAVELIIQEDDEPPVAIYTVARTVGEALLQAGHFIYLADHVQPALSDTVKPGTHVRIQRSKPISVVVDGRRIRTRTHRSTVGDVLADLKIVLLGEDYATPPTDAPAEAGMEIRVARVSRQIVINQEAIPFDTHWEPDPELELDTQALGQEGLPGVREQRTQIVYEDGLERERAVIADFVARPPQPRIYKYGTKAVIRTLETPDGPIQYWRVIRMLATSYSASTAGVSSDKSYYGRTRCGQAMRGGIVAVDPRIIPLNTNVYVEGYGVGNACDTGSAIKGKRIDLGYDDDKLRLWYRWVKVYLLPPVPPNIRYILD